MSATEFDLLLNATLLGDVDAFGGVLLNVGARALLFVEEHDYFFV